MLMYANSVSDSNFRQRSSRVYAAMRAQAQTGMHVRTRQLEMLSENWSPKVYALF